MMMAQDFMNCLVVFMGAGTGGVLRYLLSRFVTGAMPDGFPLGTLLVNLIGCLIIGLLSGIFGHFVIQPNIRLLVFTGFLGGFTTFSAFGLETFNLFKDSEIRAGILNILITNIAGIGLVIAGFMLFGLVLKFFR